MYGAQLQTPTRDAFAEPVGEKYDMKSMRPASKPEQKFTIMSWNVAGAVLATLDKVIEVPELLHL